MCQNEISISIVNLSKVNYTPFGTIYIICTYNIIILLNNSVKGNAVIELKDLKS